MPRIDDIIDPSSEVPVADGIIPARRFTELPRARIVLLTPAGGVIRDYGMLVSFEVAPRNVPASTPIDRVDWRVRVFEMSRGLSDHTFWWEGETPYRDYARSELYPAISTFEMPAEDAVRGWSTWVVEVVMWSGDLRVGAGRAVFAVMLDVGVVAGVMLPSPLPVMGSSYVVSSGSGVATTASPAVLLPAPSPSRVADPGILLDPSQVS